MIARKVDGIVKGLRGIMVNQKKVTFTLDGKTTRKALLTGMEITGAIDGCIEMTLRVMFPPAKKRKK